MPKRNGRKGGKPWNNNESSDKFTKRESFKYGEHDDRTENTRRVSFKHNGRNLKNKQKNRDWEASIRAHFEDEDIDMNNFPGSSSNARFVSVRGGRGNYKNRVHSPVPRGQPTPNRKLLEGPSNWYKVWIPYGHRYEKDYILKQLLNHIAPDVFIPVNWRVLSNEVSFYVDDYKIASKLFSSDRQITTLDGFKLIVKVRHGMPQIEINANLKDKMKAAMASRFNPQTNALDLTKFHTDPQLSECFCALFRPILMLAAIDIIAENIPDLEALNLEDNKLHVLDHLHQLIKKLPRLKILHLKNNRIRDVTSLDSLKGSEIIELVLDGNPLCDKFTDQTVYVSEVRKRFPKLLKLDGVDLPPPIVFDVSSETKLPPSQQTFLCSQDGQEIVRQFLEQYFLIYDSDNRQPLIQAYHEHAMFSLTASYPVGRNHKNSAPLNWYQSDNRNLKKVFDGDRRHKLLRQGQLSVISYLSDMPKTKHDIYSFKVDLTFFTPQLLMLSVSGIFKEINSGLKSIPHRSFSKLLLIVPAGSGFCIANEQLHISNATEDQIKESFKIVAPPAPALAPAPVSVAIDDHTKQQMVQAMAQQSGMNIEWSTKCLEGKNWDFQEAMLTFTNLHGQGSIPPEAFAK